mmetsp:Transcript_65694/g.207872  ORF Transcript_65694/g.207872 Transcript_65694/m.207872 type:complete len:277 (-) Transcript_65694:906-1736(-)
MVLPRVWAGCPQVFWAHNLRPARPGALGRVLGQHGRARVGIREAQDRERPRDRAPHHRGCGYPVRTRGEARQRAQCAAREHARRGIGRGGRGPGRGRRRVTAGERLSNGQAPRADGDCWHPCGHSQHGDHLEREPVLPVRKVALEDGCAEVSHDQARGGSLCQLRRGPRDCGSQPRDVVRGGRARGAGLLDPGLQRLAARHPQRVQPPGDHQQVRVGAPRAHPGHPGRHFRPRGVRPRRAVRGRRQDPRVGDGVRARTAHIVLDRYSRDHIDLLGR